ncbi:MAG: hypothetical protein MZW92_40890 [Comamonadaceae bacterium]|nr:hypothetical protein [Comamonadaceae bacterium]
MLSLPTEPFRMAGFFDSDAPARPIRIPDAVRHLAGGAAQVQQERHADDLGRAVRAAQAHPQVHPR